MGRFCPHSCYWPKLVFLTLVLSLEGGPEVAGDILGAEEVDVREERGRSVCPHG